MDAPLPFAATRRNWHSAAASRSSCSDGSTLVDELAVANAHPLGAKPFGRDDYIRKFRLLTDGIITTREANRFLEAAQNVASLPAGELHRLNVALPAGSLTVAKPGIF